MKRLILLVLLLKTPLSPLQAIELERVILSTNNDPIYIEFWPIVAPLWEAMGLRPTLALIADEACQVDTSLGDVIRFAPLPGVPESLQAQAIRLFLPSLFPDEGCLISDIDMIPISKAYFVQGAAECPDEGFLVYRDNAEGYKGRYPMCYVAAKGRIFSSVFGITNPEEILDLVSTWARLEYGWNTDEILLYSYTAYWESKGGHVVRLGHVVGPRLDRGNWNLDWNTLEVSKYIDCHCPRPYSAFRDSIDRIVVDIHKQLQNP